MSVEFIKKRVRLTSMNLFGCEVDDSLAQLSIFPEYFHIRAVGQEERVLFTEILSVNKKLWWYEISWSKNNKYSAIKISAVKLSSFVEQLNKRLIT